MTQSDDLLQKNIARLTERYTQFDEWIRRAGETTSKIVGSIETDDLNLDIGHTTLYPYNAVRFAVEQVDPFLKSPNRFYLDPPVRNIPIWQEQHRLTETILDYLEAQDDPPELPTAPTIPRLDHGGFLIVYGIGLGLHLPRLFSQVPVEHFVLVEEHVEFFRHTLSLIDWSEILDRLDEKGQTLHFIFEKDLAAAASHVHWYLRGRGFGLIDGSYLFRHYSSNLLDHAHKDFVEKLPLLPISIGFFEDELVMLNHTTRNLLEQSFSLLDLKPHIQKDVPAIIVGSGPSLDKTIEYIKRMRGEAVIFSGGTSLLPLLRHGIRPDFHCELENGLGSLEHISRTADHYSLEGITLIGSTTVHPTMHTLFRDRILYFRDSVSSTPLWCPDEIGIHGTAPTCTNLALRAALVLAFREIYLFGIDLGTRDPKDHHSKDAYYHQNEQWLRDNDVDPVKVMNIELPGNFGGKAYTNQILHWARMMMSQAIEVFSAAKIYNCSNGISIPGTLPKLPQTIKIVEKRGRKDVTLARLMRELDSKYPGEMAPAEKMAAFRATSATYYTRLRGEIAEAIAGETGFVPFYRRIETYLDPDGTAPFQKVLRAVNVGTLMMCSQIGYFFYRRLPEDQKTPFMKLFLTELDKRICSMNDRIDALMQDLQGLERAA